MLTQDLDRETERYLADILAQEKTTTNELIRNLIRDRWIALQQGTEVAMPASNSGAVNPTHLPKPRNSKQLIADFVRRKSQRPL